MIDDDDETDLTGDKTIPARTHTMTQKMKRSAYLGSYKSKFTNTRKKPITLPKLQCLKDDPSNE